MAIEEEAPTGEGDDTTSAESSDLELRIRALEERYCHQERLVDDLSEVLYQQTRALERVSLRLEVLERRLAALDDPSNGKASP